MQLIVASIAIAVIGGHLTCVFVDHGVLRGGDAVEVVTMLCDAFRVLLPVRPVGVKGDDRSYDYACTLVVVTSTDGITADYYPSKHDFLRPKSTLIANEVRGINRVTYDVTCMPAGTIEWEKEIVLRRVLPFPSGVRFFNDRHQMLCI